MYTSFKSNSCHFSVNICSNVKVSSRAYEIYIHKHILDEAQFCNCELYIPSIIHYHNMKVWKVPPLSHSSLFILCGGHEPQPWGISNRDFILIIVFFHILFTLCHTVHSFSLCSFFYSYISMEVRTVYILLNNNALISRKDERALFSTRTLVHGDFPVGFILYCLLLSVVVNVASVDTPVF